VTRVCLDSNVLVAAFIARGLCLDLLSLVVAEHELIVPAVVAEEVQRVLSVRLRAGGSALGEAEELLAECDIVPSSGVPCPIAVRDPDDERVLAEAIVAGAEILVTGDQDLLLVARESPIRILPPRAFMVLARAAATDTD
jgi:putative PIN family toxin of toxin-antitoxin system